MSIGKIQGHHNSNILHCLEWRESLKKAILYGGKVILFGKAIIHKHTNINTSPKKKRFSKVYCHYLTQEYRDKKKVISPYLAGS